MWEWEQVDEDRSGTSGDLARMFKNEEIKEPGFLAENAPSADATLMAREVIQNSWDAGRELAETLRDKGIDSRHQFEIRFEFKSLDGEDRDGLITTLGLTEHASRILELGDKRSDLGLQERTFLDRIEAGQPLRVLQITEHGATGMYGPWSGSKSKMYLALVSLGFTVKAAGAGGSYGYGKAGLIRGSAIRTLAAYTCFLRREEEPVTRRLLGMTYWGPHERSEESFTGFARLGAINSNGGIEPFTDGEADRMAAQLGLETRRSDLSRISDLGTTFLLVDPTCTPEDLCTAVERNWWPALISDEFAVTITGYEGETLPPRPKRQPELTPFINAFERVTQGGADAADGSFRQWKFNTDALSRRSPAGALGLESDVEGWTYPSVAEAVGSGLRHRSLVALVRGPRMVVEYMSCGTQPPFVRGTFVADSIVDDLLRQTEPKAHDAWETKAADSAINPVAPKVAKSILDHIKSAVAHYRKELKPALPRIEDVKLRELSQLFKSILDNPGSEPPDLSGDRLFVVRLGDPTTQVVEGDHGSQLTTKATGTVRLGRQKLDQLAVGDVVNAEVKIRFLYLEDDSARQEILKKKQRIKVRAGKSVVDEVKPAADETWVKVALRKLDDGGSEKLEVTAESKPYPADVTCRVALDVRLEPTTQTEGASDQEGGV